MTSYLRSRVILHVLEAVHSKTPFCNDPSQTFKKPNHPYQKKTQSPNYLPQYPPKMSSQSNKSSFSYSSSFYSSTSSYSSSTNGQGQSYHHASSTYTDPSGTTTRTVYKEPGRPAVEEVRSYDGRMRRVDAGEIGQAGQQRRIEDVTDEDREKEEARG